MQMCWNFNVINRCQGNVLMEWRTEFSVGDDKFDNDHKIIFGLVDEFKRILSEGENAHEMLEDSFDKLIDYIDEHFAREEVFMKKIGYPNIVEHHGKHAEMEDKMRALFTRYSEGDPTVSEALGNFVEDWWYSHILKEDMKYREFAEG